MALMAASSVDAIMMSPTTLPVSRARRGGITNLRPTLEAAGFSFDDAVDVTDESHGAAAAEPSLRHRRNAVSDIGPLLQALGFSFPPGATPPHSPVAARTTAFSSMTAAGKDEPHADENDDGGVVVNPRIRRRRNAVADIGPMLAGLNFPIVAGQPCVPTAAAVGAHRSTSPIDGVYMDAVYVERSLAQIAAVNAVFVQDDETMWSDPTLGDGDGDENENDGRTNVLNDAEDGTGDGSDDMDPIAATKERRNAITDTDAFIAMFRVCVGDCGTDAIDSAPAAVHGSVLLDGSATDGDGGDECGVVMGR